MAMRALIADTNAGLLPSAQTCERRPGEGWVENLQFKNCGSRRITETAVVIRRFRQAAGGAAMATVSVQTLTLRARWNYQNHIRHWRAATPRICSRLMQNQRLHYL
jgi:hypothetical protein